MDEIQGEVLFSTDLKHESVHLLSYIVDAELGQVVWHVDEHVKEGKPDLLVSEARRALSAHFLPDHLRLDAVKVFQPVRDHLWVRQSKWINPCLW